MKIIIQLLSLVLNVALMTTVQAQTALPTAQDPQFDIASDWTLESDQNGIQTYTRYLEGLSLRAFKVVTTVNAPLAQSLMFLNDNSQFERWISMIHSANIVQAPDPNGVSYSHLVTQLPWPITPRDAVVKVTIDYDSIKQQVNVSSVGVPDFIPLDTRFVRIREYSAVWKINKLSDGRLRLELTSHSDSGGNIPKWLSNRAVLQLPSYMFSRLQVLLESDEVKNSVFDSVAIFGKEVELN